MPGFQLADATYELFRIWFAVPRAKAPDGAFERIFLVLADFGGDGLMTRVEWFEADHEAEALARFEALAPEPSSGPPVPGRLDRRPS